MSKTILLVEDNTVVQKLLKSQIEKFTHKVIVSDSAEVAYELVANTPIDIVITDVCLPKENGLNLINNLQTNNPEIEFILISGDPDFLNYWNIKEFKSRLNIKGALEKPVDINNLIAIIDG